MGTQQKEQNMLIGLLKPITKDEHFNILQHEIDLLKHVAQEKDIQSTMYNHLVGQPKKFKVIIRTNDEIKQELNEEQGKKRIACAQAHDIHQLISTRLVATHHGNNKKNTMVTKLMPSIF